MGAARVEWIRDRTSFAEIAEAWRPLADRHPDPFMRLEWIEPWLDAFAPRDRFAACTLWRGDELAAGLVMVARRGQLLAATNVHTPVLRPLATDQAATAVLMREIATAAPAVVVGPLPMDEEAAAALVRAGLAARPLLVRERGGVSPITPVRGRFEDYRAVHSRRWRELERRTRKAAREHGVTLELMQCETGRLLDEGLALEASGWKHRKRTAILDKPQTAGFYRSVAERFAERGELALSGLRFDGELVAFDLALLHARRYWLLKTGYDERYRPLGPGLILRRAVIERCFHDSLDAHEFLGPDMAWKRLFADEQRAHATVRLYARRPGPLARYGWRRVRPAVRDVYRLLARRRRFGLARSP
jgi:CelD/BcsL family acetyltransferase involved in cellulose biosynthesis